MCRFICGSHNFGGPECSGSFLLLAPRSRGDFMVLLCIAASRAWQSMRALLCVGVAYFLIGVLVPVISLSAQGQLNGFTMKGSVGATARRCAGRAGAVCIIFAFRSGGLPTYVMPLVFAGAPLVNVLYSMWLHPPKTSPNPLLYLGFVLAALGGGLVLYFKPQS